MNNFFENLLGISPDWITTLVVGICLLLFFCAFFSEKIRVIPSAFREIAPALMVSAGIIGTFWGTFIALADFQTGTDNQAMVDSIPAVLNGMKTAFITSLIGLFFAFISRVALSFKPAPDPKPLPIEKTTVDLLQEIKDGISGEGDKSMSSQLDALQSEYRDSAKDLKQSISGDGESSVTSQLMKLRNENSDGFKKLDGHLDGLAETIRESLVENMGNLVTEIREVIVNQLSTQLKVTNDLLRDQLGSMLDRIEEALIKQFGETFKQFNEATQAIKKWQEDHREQVEQLTEAFALTAQGIEKIRTDCESIPETMKNLQELMGELEERLEAFADMKESAQQSFPTIKENLDAIGADLQKSATGFSGLEKVITDAHAQAGELAKHHIEISQQHVEDASQRISEINKQFAETAKNMLTENRDAANHQKSEMQSIVDEIKRTSERCVTDTQEALTEMTEKHVEQINGELKAIIESWGANVVGIAEELKKTITSIEGES